MVAAANKKQHGCSVEQVVVPRGTSTINHLHLFVLVLGEQSSFQVATRYEGFLGSNPAPIFVVGSIPWCVWLF